MPSTKYSYTQTCIGDCGHVCDAWPSISPLGEVPRVVCRICTGEKYGLDFDESEGLVVWVRVKEKTANPTTPKSKATKKAKPKPKKVSVWDQFIPGPA